MGLRVWVGEHKLHSRSALTAVFQPPANESAVAVGTVPLRCADTVPRQLGTAAAAAAATAAGGRLLHSVTRRRRPLRRSAMDALSAALLACLSSLVVVAATSDSSSCVEDVPSRVARADVVVDARVRGRHTADADTAPQSYFNVTARPRRVLKGWLQRDPAGASSYLPLIVGPFAISDDRASCVPGVTLGARYLLFLAGNGSSAVSGGRKAAQQTTLFFQLSGFPAPYTGETASLARQYSCTGCSK